MMSDDLAKRATLLRPVKMRDADGNIVQFHEAVVTVWANLLSLKGGENVMQGRMLGRSPAIVTLRASSTSRQITAEWRVSVGGRVYEVREHPRETQDRAMLEMLVEAQS